MFTVLANVYELLAYDPALMAFKFAVLAAAKAPLA